MFRDAWQRERDTPRSSQLEHYVCTQLGIHPQADGRVQPNHPKELKDILQYLHPSIGHTLHLFLHAFRLGRSQAQETSSIWHPVRR